MKVLMATAIYPTPANPAFGAFIQAQVESLRQAGVEVELLVLGGRSRKLMYPKGIFQVRQRLADGSIDLIHAHYSYVGMVARAQWRVPVVVSYLGSDLLGSIKDDQGQKTRSSRLDVLACQILAQLADAVIVKSQEMASKLWRKDVHVIPNEVNFEVFRPIERERARAILNLDPRKPYLLFAANPAVHRKGFPLAKAVAEHLAASDPSIELLVVYKETQERLALYLNACDALVFPSFQEGSPNIVKQAMACNLPIVATDVGDVRELIGNTQGCYICSRDILEFSNRLQEILRSRERTQGRHNIRHLDRPVVARKIIKVYEETLNKPVLRGKNETEKVQ
jgi:glycosyltransferase involved in cell wall biosynthesis